MMYVPDNYSAYEAYEAEQERLERRLISQEIEEERPFDEEETHAEYKTFETKRNQL